MTTRNYSCRLYFYLGLIVLLTSLSYVASADIFGPKCLSCEGVGSPSDCLYTKRCWAHERCFTEHLTNSSGATWYNFGCKIQEECSLLESFSERRRGFEPTVTLCERCCTGDACNTHLCSTTTGPQSLSCFSCDDTDDSNACHVVKHCRPHEVCYAESVIEDSPVPRHTLGCVSQSDLCITYTDIYRFEYQGDKNPYI
ncbi:uncharacterized protein LOC135464491 [Liolophura sinensis]|uniref:uncharacterized protein LOC135464491 n=1 Tax=Liolophura sinensis TaxID=3198878 RepID=UPI0031582B42